MAGELILPLSRRPPLSVDYMAPSAGVRGDLVELPGGPGFLLADVEANGRVAVGVQSHMVSVPQPTTPRAWKAGEHVYLDHDKQFVHQTNQARWRIGWCHEDTAADVDRVPVVWNPSEGHYYQRLDETTTPKFEMVNPLSSNLSVADGGSVTRRLCTTDLKGIIPGVPVRFDFDGTIYWLSGNTEHNGEFILTFTLWPGDATKQIRLTTNTFRNARANRIAGTTLSDFSQTFIFSVGTTLIDAISNSTTYTLTAADFEGSIPLQLDLRLFPHKRDTIDTKIGQAMNLRRLNLIHPHMVISQSGRILS